MCPPNQNGFGCIQCNDWFFEDPNGYNGKISYCQDCKCNVAGAQNCNNTGYCKYSDYLVKKSVFVYLNHLLIRFL